MMGGFYQLNREILNSDLWLGETFTRGQALVDLHLLANWSTSEMLCKGVMVHIERGQVFRSIGFFMKRWNWTEKKVRYFFKQLEAQGLITRKGTTLGTIININDYDPADDLGRAGGQAMGQAEGTSKTFEKCTSSSDQGRTNGRAGGRTAGGEKNKELNKKITFTPPSVDEVRTYCQERGNCIDPDQFVNFYESKGWTVGKASMKDWKAAVRTWETRQKKEEKNNVQQKIYTF